MSAVILDQMAQIEVALNHLAETLMLLPDELQTPLRAEIAERLLRTVKPFTDVNRNFLEVLNQGIGDVQKVEKAEAIHFVWSLRKVDPKGQLPTVAEALREAETHLQTLREIGNENRSGFDNLDMTKLEKAILALKR